jgi:ketosteroid isomerase-like protein
MNEFTYIRLWSLVFLISTLLSCRSDNDELNLDNEKQIVEKTIHNSIGWAKNKNIGLLYSVIANDSNYLEVDPNNRIVKGFHDFKKAEEFWMSDDFKAIKYDIRDLSIHFSKSGDVAWFFCILDDINEWKGQPANWENTRWTGVLEKRDNTWIIVQMHFSFASN